MSINYALIKIMWILRILGPIKFCKWPIKFCKWPIKIWKFEWDMAHWPILRAHHHFGLGLTLPYGKVTKTQENITYKRSALSQQVAEHKAAKDYDSVAKTNTYNKKDPQKKHHLGMVSKKIPGGLKLTSPLI